MPRVEPNDDESKKPEEEEKKNEMDIEKDQSHKEEPSNIEMAEAT